MVSAPNSRQLLLVGLPNITDTVAGTVKRSYRPNVQRNMKNNTTNSILFFESKNGTLAAFLISINKDPRSGSSFLWTEIKTSGPLSGATPYSTYFYSPDPETESGGTNATVVYEYFDANKKSWMDLWLHPQNCCDLGECPRCTKLKMTIADSKIRSVRF